MRNLQKNLNITWQPPPPPHSPFLDKLSHFALPPPFSSKHFQPPSLISIIFSFFSSWFWGVGWSRTMDSREPKSLKRLITNQKWSNVGPIGNTLSNRQIEYSMLFRLLGITKGFSTWVYRDVFDEIRFENVEDNGSHVCSPFTLIDSIAICQILVICIKNIYTWNSPFRKIGEQF